MTNEQLKAFINTAKYKYYKDYVEPLEKEHDQLLKENESLKNKNKLLRMQNTKLKNKLKEKPVLNESDAERYRNMCSKLEKKNAHLTNLLYYGGKKR